MGDLLLGVEVGGAVLLLGLLLMAAVVARRRWLRRASGTFDCSLRSTQSAMGKGWALGVARYEADRIDWFRVFDISPRPRRALRRCDLVVQERRYPAGPEAFSVMSGSVILRCRDGRRVVELAMSEQAATGFASWLEAAPPGQNVSVA